MSVAGCARVEREVRLEGCTLGGTWMPAIEVGHETTQNQPLLKNQGGMRCLCLRKDHVAVVWKVDWVRMGGCCPTMIFRTQGLRWG